MCTFILLGLGTMHLSLQALVISSMGWVQWRSQNEAEEVMVLSETNLLRFLLVLYRTQHDVSD